MTREHVPPESANNDSAVGIVVHPFDTEAVVREVAEWNEGHVVRTIDANCNNRASNWGYVSAYRRWVDFATEQARRRAQEAQVDPLRGSHPFELTLPYDVQPARFVRQVVGMLLAVQATEELFAAHPVLSELIGGDPANESKRRQSGLDIHPLHLYLSVCNARWNYFDRAVLVGETLVAPASETLWRPPSSTTEIHWLWVLCLSPFTLVLSTKPATDRI